MFIRVIIIIINLFIEGSLISAQALFTLIRGWPLQLGQVERLWPCPLENRFSHQNRFHPELLCPSDSN